MKQCNKNLRILFSSIFVTLMISSMSIALACSTIPKSDQNIKSSSLPHNMGVYEYSQTVDAWVLTDSWHDPSANDFPVGPNDYVWTEPGWSSSILLINADPSAPPPNIGGGGGNPPGGPGFQDPKTVNAQKKAASNSKSCEDPIHLGTMTVIGSSGGVRNWLGGVSTGWAIIGNFSGGGGGTGNTFRVGSIIINARAYAELAAGIGSITYDSGIRDIEYFRLIGGHLPYAQGSLINWNAAQVNWNLYGASDPALSHQQVMQNFVGSLSDGG